MKPTDSEREKQALDLMAERAISGLDPAEEVRLDELLAACDGLEDDESFDRVVARLDVAWSPLTRMPSGLRSRIAADGHRAASRNRQGVQTPAPGESTAASSSVFRIFPWIVAAAACILAVVVWLDATDETTTVTPAESRRQLLASATDVVQPAWGESEHEGYESVTGDVVWSRQKQEGYMLLRGLAPNGPEEQYQLWIVAGGHRHPVDGGVFDVTSSGEIVVPIDAKLDVLDAKAFAITREKRGGVVVSDGPLLVVAAL